MGIAYNTSIVRDGLVLYLDAANKKSYSGTGTVWKDLSGQSNNGTLVNGVGYSSDNKGAMAFDGVDDHCLHGTSVISGNSELTVTGFFFRTGTTLQKAMWGIGGQSDRQGINSYSLSGSNLLSIDLWGTTTIQSPVSYDLNMWNYCAWVYRGDVFSRSNISLYKNGVEYTGTSLSVARGGETSAPIINTTGTVLGRAGTIENRYSAPVNIATISFYNRALTETEIRQNFEAFRGRYGI